MTMNRVQFQPGLSMAQFMDSYGSGGQCEAALIESRWPSGFVCPACGYSGRSTSSHPATHSNSGCCRGTFETRFL
ncbi:MAG: transposase [Burkholderiales bacterium]